MANRSLFYPNKTGCNPTNLLWHGRPRIRSSAHTHTPLMWAVMTFSCPTVNIELDLRPSACLCVPLMATWWTRLRLPPSIFQPWQTPGVTVVMERGLIVHGPCSVYGRMKDSQRARLPHFCIYIPVSRNEFKYDGGVKRAQTRCCL